LVVHCVRADVTTNYFNDPRRDVAKRPEMRLPHGFIGVGKPTGSARTSSVTASLCSGVAALPCRIRHSRICERSIAGFVREWTEADIARTYASDPR
jgi:hypothetical protein